MGAPAQNQSRQQNPDRPQNSKQNHSQGGGRGTIIVSTAPVRQRSGDASPISSDTIFIYRREKDGSFRRLASFNGGLQPSYHCVHKHTTMVPHRRKKSDADTGPEAGSDANSGTGPSTQYFIYVVNEKEYAVDGESGTIRAYTLDPATAQYSYINEVDSGGDSPCFLVINPEKTHLLCANYNGASISLFKIQADGSLSTARQTFSWECRGAHPQRQECSHPHSICFSPDGRYLFVPDLGCDTIRVLRWIGGEMPLADCPNFSLALAPGSGPRMMAFIPQRQQAWVVNELSSSANLYQYAEGTLTLIRTENLRCGQSSDQPNTASHLFCNEHYALFSNRGLNNIVRLDHSASGCFAGSDAGGGAGDDKTPRFFQANPEQALLYIAWQHSDRIDEYSLTSGGNIAFIQNCIHVPSPTCISSLWD